MLGYIYTITHDNGKTYVGQTRQKPLARWNSHKARSTKSYLSNDVWNVPSGSWFTKSGGIIKQIRHSEYSRYNIHKGT